MNARVTTPLAWSLWALSAAFTASGLFFMYLNGTFANLLDESVGIDAAVALAFPTVGAVIASRRPGNPIGWLFCAIGLLQGITVFGGEYAVYALLTEPGSLPAGVLAAWFSTWTWLPGLVLMGTFLLLLFPNGRLPSRRWRPVAWLAACITIMAGALLAIAPWDLLGAGVPAENPFEIRVVWPVAQALAIPLLVVGVSTALLSVLSLVLRFRRASGVERQQLKWFAYAGAVSVAVLVYPGGELASTLQILVAPLLPIAAGIAILRYGLFDIDVVINRTLVYGALTASLALVYFGGVVGFQTLFRALTGGESQLAIVASTLAIAALFVPLRRRVQGFVDRRFYRSKYDAQKTLQAFSSKLRDETDLDRLGEELVLVVRGTMQPAHASLWLRDPGEGR